MFRTNRRSLLAGAGSALLLSNLALLVEPISGVAEAAATAAGYVYVLNNDLSGANSITVFARAGDGRLTQQGTTKIGGLGSVSAFADGTQGSLIHSTDRSRLFAVDAGSDQISVVEVANGKLDLVGVFPSGGAGPVSLTYQEGRLYVLNAANTSSVAANVAGFRVDSLGRLHPIAGSTRSLSASHPNPAQVQLDPSGRFLLVSEKGTNLIDLYRVARDGSLSGPTSVPSVGAVPFGMAFARVGPRPEEFVVADAAGGPNGTGAATAYRLADGKVHLIDGPVPDHQIAPCWMVITGDGRYAYTSNADSQAISGYRINADGTITLLDANGVTGTTPADTFPIEEALSRDSQYLYVLDTRLLLPTPGPATLSGFRIRNDGHLTPVVDPAGISLPVSAIGLTAN